MPYRTLYKDSTMTDRERKNVVLLDVVRRNGPIAKTDIARITRHNIVTVSNYVEHYIKKKLVLEKGLDVSSGGRRPELIELNGEWGYVVGVDIAHRDLTCVVTTLGPKILRKETAPRPKGHMEGVLTEAVKLVQKTINGSGISMDKIKGIGVGIQGVIDKNAGTVRDTDITRGITIGSYASAKGILEKEFGVQVLMGNDASLAALAEKRLSLRIDDENVIYMLGDVGAGVIVQNELFWGSTWSAGELQLNLHNASDLNLPEWVNTSNFFRSRGEYMGLLEDGRKLIEDKTVKTILKDKTGGDPSKLTLEHIFSSAFENDEPTLELADRVLTLLALKISYMANFLNPDVIVIGGGFEKGGDFVLNRVRAIVKKLAMEETASSVKIILSRLGDDVVALGAVSLMTQQLFSEL
jgi:predicted NBD/HSP70 family sugar kinase